MLSKAAMPAAFDGDDTAELYPCKHLGSQCQRAETTHANAKHGKKGQAPGGKRAKCPPQGGPKDICPDITRHTETCWIERGGDVHKALEDGQWTCRGAGWKGWGVRWPASAAVREKVVYTVACIQVHHVNGDIWQWGPSLVENLKPVSVATTQWVVKIGSNQHWGCS